MHRQRVAFRQPRNSAYRIPVEDPCRKPGELKEHICFLSKVVWELIFKGSTKFKHRQKDRNRRLGGCSTGKSFRFVRACVRAVWLPSGIGSQIRWAGLFPFPYGPGLVVGLFLFWAGWSWGAFPFAFWARDLSLFPSPTPQTSYPTLVGLIGKVCVAVRRSVAFLFCAQYLSRS